MSEERVGVLLVTASDKAARAISDFLPQDRFYQPVVAKSAGEARRIFDSLKHELVIVDGPLRDDYGGQLAMDFGEDSFTEVLFLTKNEYYEQLAGKLEELGIVSVSKPADRKNLLNCLGILYAHVVKMRGIKKRIEELQTKNEELQLVSRAKLMLMEKYKMTEADAHRYIEKSAMDHCMKRRDVAEKIILSLK